MSAVLSQFQPAPLRRPGIAAGIAVSLVLHAALIFGWRLAAPSAPDEPRPAKAMTVWLQPPAPPKPIVAKVEPPPPKPEPVQPRKKERPQAAERASPPKAVIAAAAEPTPAPAAAQAITLPPASTAPDPLHPELQPKQFDMNAALKTARKEANAKDPARAGLPVAQLEDHPLYPEQRDSKLARDIKGAARPSCLKEGGNLLTPLFWLLDKKDSGCKF
ncbi:hypothetical protein [Duganella sp. HH105]|uniref:hypothetical protein n=1 Tax=Duganella sp. HH105 TaxID=1781067 RepID=UPI000877D32F|nr:hypothetical protein [Duganella sp. HH105]OEZ61360.1 hypothetical protein DUGA6_23860 [Duganella sp. HH105]